MNNLFQYTDIKEDTVVRAQVCVIGSGCGGATLAKKLTDLGIDVVILEQGGFYAANDMDQNELNMAGKLSANRNFSTNHDAGTFLSYGANVGGASVHYWADSYRTPQFKLDEWSENYGVKGHGATDLESAFLELENELNIHEPAEEFFNPMNQHLRVAAKKLGWKGHKVPQARKNCQKSGHCMQGCVYSAKQSQIVTHIPQALNQGGRLFADAMADEFIYEGDRVNSLNVKMIDRPSGNPNGIRLSVIADHYVLAGGGFNSSFFMLKQGLKSRLPALGKYFSMNPTAMVHAIYPDDIVMWRNIPAAFGIDHFIERKFSQGSYLEGGYLVMPNQLHPGTFAAMLPGFGEEHARWMSQMSRIGGTISWVDDIPDELGEIRMTSGGGREVYYPYGAQTTSVLRDSLKKQATLHFAAGAKKVIIAGAQGIQLGSENEISIIDNIEVSAGQLFMGAPHPGGGCRMGENPDTSVVDSHHKVHGFSNLHVADSSVFPTSSALDPSLTIMAFSHIAAQNIAARF